MATLSPRALVVAAVVFGAGLLGLFDALELAA